MIAKWVSVLVWVIAFPVLADAGDAAVREARAAWAAKKPAEFARAAARVPPDHVLAPYVDYWRISLSAAPAEADIRAHLDAYPGSRTAELLRNDWLKTLGARGEWSRYLAEYAMLERPEPVHQCYAHRARWAQGDRSQAADAAALWFTGRDLPSACAPLFEALFTAGVLTSEDRWRRIRLAFEAGNPGVARAIAGGLPAREQLAPALFERAQREPAKLLAAGLDAESRLARELALYALERLARESHLVARQAYAGWQARFSPEERRAALGSLAAWAARRHDPVALAWFAETGGENLNDAEREWWARAALRAGDWTALGRAIDGMGETTRHRPEWRYWRARAWRETGQRVLAMPVLLALSREHHFYGQLASEALGPVVSAPLPAARPSAAAAAAVAHDAGLARALKLYALDWRTEAHAEWNWAIRQMGDDMLLAAADLARRAEWYDRAIHTAERTRELHDFELRFLAPYRDLAQKAARDYGLDEAWVFGLMRQESRFVAVARSAVGASGLMQIMPATGQWIARRLGIARFNPADIIDPATNIRFGAYYLRHVQDSLDGSAVLATAAYNAGPSRAQRWRGSQPMEAAAYIESIPFAETRDYVKKVMSNAAYYAARFNAPGVSLQARLGVIPPRRSAEAAAPEAPLETDSAAD